MTTTSLVRIDADLNADWYIFDILSPVVVPYNKGLPNAPSKKIIQDHASCSDSPGYNIGLLPWPAQSPDLSPTENNW